MTVKELLRALESHDKESEIKITNGTFYWDITSIVFHEDAYTKEKVLVIE